MVIFELSGVDYLKKHLTRAGETRDQEKIAILDSIFLNFGYSQNRLLDSILEARFRAKTI